MIGRYMGEVENRIDRDYSVRRKRTNVLSANRWPSKGCGIHFSLRRGAFQATSGMQRRVSAD
jgi:hypothetical protein